jgi:hypothetical protein
MVVAGRTTTLFSLQVLDHLDLLAVGVHLGLTVGIDLLLSEVVGTATSYDRVSLGSISCLTAKRSFIPTQREPQPNLE